MPTLVAAALALSATTLYVQAARGVADYRERVPLVQDTIKRPDLYPDTTKLNRQILEESLTQQLLLARAMKQSAGLLFSWDVRRLEVDLPKLGEVMDRSLFAALERRQWTRAQEINESTLIMLERLAAASWQGLFLSRNSEAMHWQATEMALPVMPVAHLDQLRRYFDGRVARPLDVEPQVRTFQRMAEYRMTEMWRDGTLNATVHKDVTAYTFRQALTLYNDPLIELCRSIEAPANDFRIHHEGLDTLIILRSPPVVERVRRVALRRLRLMVAIEQHRRRHGSYPADLVGWGDVAFCPQDGAPFTYERLPNDPGFLLKSKGFGPV